MLERYADMAAIRHAAAAAAARWQDMDGAADTAAFARFGSDLLRARIGALGLLALELGKASAAGVPREAMRAARRIIGFELERLSRGHIRPSLYMAAEAAALATVAGQLARPPGAFFLPVVPLLPPAGGEENSPDAFATAVEAHRPLYEAALIRFAHGGDKDALLAMQSALIAIENRNPTAEYRTVLALASAFLSAIEEESIKPGEDASLLFSRIDAVLRAASRQNACPDPCIASRLAHALAQIPAEGSRRAALMQQRLGLKSLLCQQAPTIQEKPAPDVFDRALQALVDAMEACFAEHGDGQGVLQAAERLRLACAVNPDALSLASTLEDLLKHLMADAGARTSAWFDYLVEFLARMSDAVFSYDSAQLARIAQEEVGLAERVKRDGGVPDPFRATDDQAVSDFFAEAVIDAREALLLIDERDGIEPLAISRACELLDSVAAIMRMCSPDRDAAAALSIRDRIATEAQPGILAPALDTLVRYLETAVADPANARRLFQEVLNQCRQARVRTEAEDVPGDPEVFEVFFEETREIVAAIRKKVGDGHAILAKRGAAVTTRRGFHTLKGSARIAGLALLGEVMQGVEAVFNHWLDQEPPYPLELSRFTADAAGFALTVCEAISRNGGSRVDGSAIAEAAARLLPSVVQGNETALAHEPPILRESTRDPAPDAASETLDPDLLALYFSESAELLLLLREQLAEARDSFVSFELVRAAHGLAGMSRTVGLAEIAQLALPIEDWASRLHDMRRRPPGREVDLILAVAVEIAACIDAVKSEQRRAPDLRLVAWLSSICAEATVTAEDIAFAAAEPGAASWCPAPAAAPTAADQPAEEIDPLVLAEFAEEATDLLQAIDDELVAPTPDIAQINRFIHTFKGGARLCGALQLGNALHDLENLTARPVAPGEARPLLTKLDQELDRVRMLLSVLLTPEAADAGATSGKTEESDENISFRVTSAQIAELTAQLDNMRVGRDMLAQQLLEAGEAVENIDHPVRRIEEIAAQIQIEAETRMDAGGRAADSLFDALEFDRFTALHELTRKLSEAVQDVLVLREGLGASLSRAERALLTNRSAAEVLSTRLAGISRGPLEILEARLKAAARSAAATLGKSCQVQLIASRVRIERAVLDRIAPALDHLVRNSVAHGIESPTQRRAAGKPETGTITLSARQRGELAEIRVADDGGGINLDAVRRKIRERGLEQRYPNQENLLEALFDPGFSTAETLTQVAGRGVGLDVVRDIVTHLGGRVQVDNPPGQGAVFTLTVPVSSTFVSGVMLSIGCGVYLLPGASVSGFTVLPGDTLRRAMADGAPVDVKGRATDIVWLGSLVDTGTRPAIQSYNKVALVDGGRTGFFADEIEYVSGILTKPFAQAAAWGGSILGCAVLHDGRTALIIDPARTLALLPRRPEHPLQPSRAERQEEPLVLIVDDSITVRKVSGRLLARNGLRIMMAENGKVALDKLLENRNDLPMAILMDIEMPVMDGFEATQHIKSNPLTRHIPVIIISSRNVEKHIDHAKEMGADHFLGKPYKEEILLALLRDYAKNPRAAEVA